MRAPPPRRFRAQAQRRIRRHGRAPRLGKFGKRMGHRAAKALAATDSAWVVQERIKTRREIFPMQTPNGIEMRDMLVDFAPYIFRGKMAGCLTRLSSTGLANVTRGGGQVPSFVVEPKA